MLSFISTLFILWAPTLTLGTAINSSTITWVECPPDSTFGTLEAIECGQITVPLNHSNPYGDTIELMLTRLRATSSNNRGPLFLNGGGPGLWTSNLVKAQAYFEKTGREVSRNFSPDLRSSYDLIGLDMRDQTSFDELWKRNRAFAESCHNMTGPLFTHLGTDQAIRDLDLVRQALGADVFNYLGYSYGTEVGSAYASLYPHTVGRMVIDGNLDHSMTVPQAVISLANALEDTLEYFFKWCNTTTDNALHGKDQHAVWDGILKHADEGTLIAAACEETGNCNSSITADAFIYTAQGLLENGNVKRSLPGAKSDFYLLAERLDAARDGNGTVFAAPYATSNSSSDPGVGPSYSFVSIFCSDWAHTIRSVGDMRAIATAANIVAPRTRGLGTMALAQSSCVGWPFSPSFHQRHLDFSGAPDLPPIMVVGSFHDEATAMQWSVQQRFQIPNAFNVWRNGGGHTDYHFMGETQKAIDAFLLNGTIPEDGTVYGT
ncbi:unnamed protein product [Clonostachys rosea]|uniref:AB hydrolase-1 domain-containing protein n=1 Tax=Bionectria ochroleuca TaxID=29856 RepID=A0ABY6UTK0_BIOOC|nr:unnamed protein product [Clonostachys rosea]